MQHTISYRSGQHSDLTFIYESLLIMVKEEAIEERFSQTRASLSEALFSEYPLAHALMAEVEGLPAGFCLYSTTNRNFTLFKGPGLFVHDLYVLPAYRRIGVATGLLQEIENIARSQSCSRIDGILLRDNENGSEFFKKTPQIKRVDYIHYMRLNIA